MMFIRVQKFDFKNSRKYQRYIFFFVDKRDWATNKKLYTFDSSRTRDY